MPTPDLHIISDDSTLIELMRGRMGDALGEISRMAGASLKVDTASEADATATTGDRKIPMRYRDRDIGHISHPDATGPTAVADAAKIIAQLSEHMVSRELAIGDLAGAMMESYEELDMLYSLLPAITTRTQPEQIGKVLVEETARLLKCRRVSLLVLNESRDSFTVVASRGLPQECVGIDLPLKDSIAATALTDQDLFVVNSMADRPDLAERSRGQYNRDAFAIVRVPLKARGEPLGFLTVTEREDDGEFTARDLKLLDGLSAMGASALLGCHLHVKAQRLMMSTIEALASAVDAKDHYTQDHAGRVAALCVETARQLGISDADELRAIELAGLLHDIGKIGIPDAILGKTSGLTPEEFAVIRHHVRIGADIVKHVHGLEGVAAAILYHHERYDGLGYMSGRAGDDIPLASRLVAVADAYDTMTSDRPYRKSIGKQQAVHELRRAAGSQFDPEIVEATLEVVARPPAETGFTRNAVSCSPSDTIAVHS